MAEAEVVATDDVEAVDTPVEVVETESAPKDMETTIRETYRKLKADGQTDEQTNEPAATTEKPRAKDGKFAKKAESAAAAPTGSVDESAQTPTETPAATDPTSQYPGTWKKDYSGQWAGLPAEIRAEVHRREQDFHKGLSEYREAAAFGKSIGNELLPHLDLFRATNSTPAGVVKELMGVWAEMVSGTPERKQATLLRIARDAGIDIASLAAVPQQGVAPATVQPEIQEALQRISRIESAWQQQTAEQQRQAREQAQSQVDAFKADPANEHFAALESQMAALISSGQANDLRDAYDKAIWLNPDTRAKALAKQDDERRQREAAQASVARKAASVNVIKRGTPPAPTKPSTMEDTIRTAYRKIMQ